jgi:hypothetical protein
MMTVGADQHAAAQLAGQLRQRELGHLDVLRRGVRPGVPRAQQDGQRLPARSGAVIGKRRQRVDLLTELRELSLQFRGRAVAAREAHERAAIAADRLQRHVTKLADRLDVMGEFEQAQRPVGLPPGRRGIVLVSAPGRRSRTMRKLSSRLVPSDRLDWDGRVNRAQRAAGPGDDRIRPAGRRLLSAARRGRFPNFPRVPGATFTP